MLLFLKKWTILGSGQKNFPQNWRQDILQKAKETETELNTLVRKQTRYRNPETLRKEMLKERMKASKTKKRQEAKERKEQKDLREQRLGKKRKETEVLYLGEGCIVTFIRNWTQSWIFGKMEFT